MNPLSALNLTANPALRPDLLSRAGETLSARGVPASELQTLSPQWETAPAAAGSPASGSFSNVLGQMVQDVNAKQMAAGESVNGLLTGQGVSLHQTMIAMEEANVSFQLMVEVRNRLLDSYQELMRMQV
jgi:flagellar hook-basal body complex protein FliE